MCYHRNKAAGSTAAASSRVGRGDSGVGINDVCGKTVVLKPHVQPGLALATEPASRPALPFAPDRPFSWCALRRVHRDVLLAGGYRNSAVLCVQN